MILTRRWLDRYLNLNKVTNDEISVALNSLGFEVDREIDYATLNKDLIIGLIKEHKKLEGTNLSINQVQVNKKEVVQILTAAENVRAGQFVIVAPIHSQIATGAVMGKRVIKGYESIGMMCGLIELGFGSTQLSVKEEPEVYVIKNHPNLENLIGESINVLGFDDYSWEVDLTLNHSDALGAFQLAKELGNYFKVPFTWKKASAKNKVEPIHEKISLKVDKSLAKDVNSFGYSYFSLINNNFELPTVDDLWLKISEAKSTDNPLNDVASVVALESSQPVIFVDGDKVKKLELTLQKIDEQELVVLKENDQVVTIVGQQVREEYQVSISTKNILAIYINFEPVIMRKQQKNLNQSNVNLQRYMKPLYANNFELANEVIEDYFTKQKNLAAIGPAHYTVGPVKVNNKFKISLSFLNNFLGTDLTAKQIINLFKYLDFEIKADGDELTFRIDPNRIDILGKNDISEEVARLYGYNNIPVVPLKIISNENEFNIEFDLQKKLTSYLIGMGMNNVKTYSLVSKVTNDTWNLFNLKQPVKLMSPLSANHEQYRLSLSKSIIDVISYNTAKGNKHLEVFEVGDVYYEGQKKETHLAIGISGPRDYYYAKSYADAILNLYNLDLTEIEFNVKENVIDEIHPYINAEIYAKKKLVGFIYKLNPHYELKLKLQPTYLVELNLNALAAVADLKIQNKEFSKFQASKRDLSVEVPNKVPYQTLIKTLVDGVDNLVRYDIIDLYQDEKLKKAESLAISISFVFNDLEKQMNEEQINKAWEQVLANVHKLRLKVR